MALDFSKQHLQKDYNASLREGEDWAQDESKLSQLWGTVGGGAGALASLYFGGGPFLTGLLGSVGSLFGSKTAEEVHPNIETKFAQESLSNLENKVAGQALPRAISTGVGIGTGLEAINYQPGDFKKELGQREWLGQPMLGWGGPLSMGTGLLAYLLANQMRGK